MINSRIKTNIKSTTIWQINKMNKKIQAKLAIQKNQNRV